MAVARVVSFENVSKDRVEELKREMTSEEGPPEGLPATEILLLHDADAEKSVVILFFDSEADYAQGDETLNAMPSGDTPGPARLREQIRRRPPNDRLTAPGEPRPPAANPSAAALDRPPQERS